uniref:MFS transporter, PPP family, 3-phenylpropionic acid transporter n=1 Tax=Candidatus Kentrum sp. MB TaxID=2138164 RepID=A0A451BGN4_9GAMM|nr:MAG: MFS transporter, PPP family, 3-phenylpropionic acid transporter [Candidatus Kentron sp. MB]VFK35702.1 MAG: MFS transporter, PPP family, 3-phenylpropionic acid transporter [Candidatus Kentron sp. MB]VFK77440.1 MAG: MFS transporter, PPP family, 3-phenylpropionic acid transporter [Candidatus Kentron sp. MB]
MEHPRSENLSPASSIPYWQLSNFYLFYFASAGILTPYFGVYLQSLGFCPRKIGVITAILFIAKAIAPNVWGWLGDRHGKYIEIVRITAFVSAISFAGIYFSPAALFGWFVLVITVFGFFWNAVLPQVEVVTLNHLGADRHNYSHIRLWGSIGFILAVLLFGELLNQYGTGLVAHGMLILLIGMAASSLLIPGHPGKALTRRSESLGWILRQPRVLALLLACFLMQVSHGPFYAFYSIYLDEHLYSYTLIGSLWAVGVGAEVAIFMVMPRILKYVGLRNLFVFAFALSGLRWSLMALFPMVLWVQIVSQLLHAATFGVFHVVSVLFIHRFFTETYHSFGQSLYRSIGTGLGGAVGVLGGGFLWHSTGGEITYLVAAGISISALFIVWRWIRDKV